jgi:manganese/zinc/iron transport system permease protein
MGITLTIFLLIITAVIAHTLMGCLIVPLRGALIIDATAHSIVFGIAIGFLITQDLLSPWLFIFSFLSALIMNFLILFLNKRKEISYDASIGLSFSILFSFGIILISIFARNIHLDIDMILLGNIEYSIYDLIKIPFLNITIQKSFLALLISITSIVSFYFIFWNDLKIILFDFEYAKIKGIKIKLIEYIFILISSYTIVSSFNLMGAIILVGINASPILFARRSLSYCSFIIKSLVYNISCSIIGTIFAIYFNIPLAATVALFTTSIAILKTILVKNN